MRFRRRAKLFPGVYLNFSKSGISTTIGVPGASVNFGSKGTYLNTGIPGTGFYDRKRIDGNDSAPRSLPFTDSAPTPVINEPEIGAIRSQQAEATTTKGLNELRKTLLDCYTERTDLQTEIEKAKGQLTTATVLWVISYVILIGLFMDWFKKNRQEKTDHLEDLNEQLENCFVEISMDMESDIEQGYKALQTEFRSLMTCARIWDITSSVLVDRKSERSAASKSVTRRPVSFSFGTMDIVKSKYDAMHLENANGGDLYLYPAFIVIVDSQKKFGLIDLKEVEFKFHAQRFVEEESVPKDAKVVDKTWAKVNKNGTPDKRFKENYEIPICQYGEMALISKTGLNEAYHLSCFEKSEKFSSAMQAYLGLIKS